MFSAKVQLIMRLRFMNAYGSEIHLDELSDSLKIVTKRVESLRLPIFPGGWPKDPTRDVSSVMLNALLEYEISSMRNWTSEISVAGGKIDFGHYQRDRLSHAMEVELGSSSRLDSDILKLCLIQDSNPSTSVSVMTVSDAVKKRFHAEKSANDVIDRISTLRPVVQGIDHLIVVELDVPDNSERGYTKHILNGKNKFPKEKGLFLRKAKKSDIKYFLKKNRSKFRVS